MLCNYVLVSWRYNFISLKMWKLLTFMFDNTHLKNIYKVLSRICGVKFSFYVSFYGLVYFFYDFSSITCIS